MKKALFWILLLLLFSFALFYFWERTNENCSPLFEQRVRLPENLPVGDTAFLPTLSKGNLQNRKYYTFSYSDSDRLTEWVAYELTKEELVKNAKRSDRFKKDPNIAGGVISKDYKNSGYDRGHLAPAGDMSFAGKAMDESFFMSNIAPQVPAFNRGIWKHLEEWTRECVRTNGTVYIVTGAVWDSTSERMEPCSVPVPDYFYKILFDTGNPSKGMIVFYMPNKPLQNSIFDYVITVDSLENLTGIDYFSQLPDSLEDALEAVVMTSLWR
ncbi:MAG: DNA/RNA non-specific endonuclease [Bacteroidales bacterium]|nr:DNA/RNA non-specific endonuclease [Bacteroidales bacterium]